MPELSNAEAVKTLLASNEDLVRAAIQHVADVLSDALGVNLERADVDQMTADVMAKLAEQ